MGLKWIIKGLYDKGIDVIEKGILSVSPNATKTYSNNIFKWDKTSNSVIYEETHGPLIITFTKPVTFSRYKIQIKAGNRYMRGWNLSVSYDNISFTVIDTRNENFCAVNITYDNNPAIDCGELTTKTFYVPLTTAKAIKLCSTTKDSSGTYALHFVGFDIFATQSQGELLDQSKCKTTHSMKTIVLITLLLS